MTMFLNISEKPSTRLFQLLFFSTIMLLCVYHGDNLIYPRIKIYTVQDLEFDSALDDVTEQTTYQQPSNHQHQPTTKITKTQNLATIPLSTQAAPKTSPAELAQQFLTKDFMSGGGLNFYNSLLKRRLYFSFYLNDLQNNPLSPLDKNKKVCTFLVDNSPHRIDVATGYNCLLQFQMKGAGAHSGVNIFRAIKYASLSLEAFYTQTATINLMRAIISGYEREVTFIGKRANDINQFCTGDEKDEEKFLEKVLKLNIPRLKERVMARQSFIHMFGRSSFNENATHIDLELAINKQNYFRNATEIKQNNVIDIVLTVSEDYAVAAATCIVSALLNSDLDSFYRFHVVQDPVRLISEASRKKLSSYTYIRDYSIDFIVFPVNWISDVVKKAARQNDMKFITMYRLYLDKLFPDLDSILYIDTDILVRTDLYVLKTIDMTYYIWAGAPDVLSGYMRTFCNDQLPHHFVNAGVLFVNLTNSRRVSIHDVIVDYILHVNQCSQQEQSLINTVFSDYIYFLPNRWNAITNPINERLRFSPYLVHHIGYGGKPWKGDMAALLENKFDDLPSYRQDWARYQRLTRW